MSYDYAIIGAGAAGLQLAMKMAEDPWFADKKILILDKSKKEGNDHTWCYWEKGNGIYDSILAYSWDTGYFYAEKYKKRLDLKPYRYKMIRSADFYAHAANILEGKVTWVEEEVLDANGETGIIETRNSSYQAEYIFDSRIPGEFYQKDDGHIRLLQHFKGWVVETMDPVFGDFFIMMDFRVRIPDTTSFIYVLPVSPTRALVEFTLFTPELIPDEQYEQMIMKYIGKHIWADQYEIVEKEYGVIPMTDFPLESFRAEKMMRIGTAGGWVKPSTGYSFQNSNRYTSKIVRNLKKGLEPTYDLVSKKHRRYDALMLDLLYHQNENGPAFFKTLYEKNRIQKIFRFLDEDSSIPEDLKIMSSFKPLPFIQAILKKF